MGKGVAQALEQAGAAVRIHDKLLSQNADDVEWLRRVGAEKWVAVTKDKKLRYRPREKRAYLEATVLVFVLARGQMRGEDMNRALVAALPKMARLALSVNPPALFHVGRSGEIRRMHRPRRHDHA